MSKSLHSQDWVILHWILRSQIHAQTPTNSSHFRAPGQHHREGQAAIGILKQDPQRVCWHRCSNSRQQLPSWFTLGSCDLRKCQTLPDNAGSVLSAAITAGNPGHACLTCSSCPSLTSSDVVQQSQPQYALCQQLDSCTLTGKSQAGLTKAVLVCKC